MYQIRKQLRQFCAAHRLIKGYPGKCQHLHGHNYVVTVTLQSERLNQYDFVVDFVDIRQLFENWLQQHLDHLVIVSEDDIELLEFLQRTNERYYVLEGHKNTSAECMAEFLFYQFEKILMNSDIYKAHGLHLTAVEVAETSESSAIYQK